MKDEKIGVLFNLNDIMDLASACGKNMTENEARKFLERNSGEIVDNMIKKNAQVIKDLLKTYKANRIGF